MYKHQKYRTRKNKDNELINSLQHHLFNKLDKLHDNKHYSLETDANFNDFGEESVQKSSAPHRPYNLLQQAKNITYYNRNKIENFRREIKQLQGHQTTDFMTGVSLFEKSTAYRQDQNTPNGKHMLNSLDQNKLSDLQELRRMIKKTQNNLRMYSHSVYKTQSKIMDAADKCGHQINPGLAIRISKCNLDQMFPKSLKPKTPSGQQSQTIRRRISTSANWRKSKYD